MISSSPSGTVCVNGGHPMAWRWTDCPGWCYNVHPSHQVKNYWEGRTATLWLYPLGVTWVTLVDGQREKEMWPTQCTGFYLTFKHAYRHRYVCSYTCTHTHTHTHTHGWLLRWKIFGRSSDLCRKHMVLINCKSAPQKFPVIPNGPL